MTARRVVPGFPPAAGPAGAGGVRLAAIRPVTGSGHPGAALSEVMTAVGDPAAGALASFVGMVRDHDHGRAVRLLEYQAHPSAESVLAAVLATVLGAVLGELPSPPGSAPPPLAVAAVHHTGTLEIGAPALVVAASAAHREAAFRACRMAVDRIKAQVPIWKRQIFADGTDEWVGCP